MALKYALLSALVVKPQTGYEIAREFDSAVGYFWQATHQQIYRELNHLADAGLLEFEQIEQRTKPAKKRYSITASGHRALVSWLDQPVSLQAVRDPLLVKLSSGHLADTGKLKAEVEEHVNNYQQRLALFRSYEKSFNENRAQASLEQRYLFLTLRRGITVCESWLDWAQEVLDFLTEDDDASSVDT